MSSRNEILHLLFAESCELIADIFPMTQKMVLMTTMKMTTMTPMWKWHDMLIACFSTWASFYDELVSCFSCLLSANDRTFRIPPYRNCYRICNASTSRIPPRGVLVVVLRSRRFHNVLPSRLLAGEHKHDKSIQYEVQMPELLVQQ